MLSAIYRLGLHLANRSVHHFPSLRPPPALRRWHIPARFDFSFHSLYYQGISHAVSIWATGSRTFEARPPQIAQSDQMNK